MRLKWMLILSFVAFFAACSQTVSAPSDEGSSVVESSSSKKSVSSSSKTGKSSSSVADDKKSSAKETSKSSSSKANSKSSSSVKSSSSSAEEPEDSCVGEPGNPWSGTTAKNFACGAGTKLSPYIILTAEQLAKLSFAIGANDADYQGKYFKLGADIVLNEGKNIDEKGALIADSTKLHKWTPIGNSSVSFTGSFDGDGHTVSGMFINTTSTHNGLFGNSSGTVQNVTVEDSWVYGGDYTAGVIGNLIGPGVLKRAVNKASVVGIGVATGGVVGHYQTKCCDNTGTIENVENEGFVSGKNNTGGIIGSVSETVISFARNRAEIIGVNGVGGIIGSSGYKTTLSDAINQGNVTGKEQVAGIAGYFGYRFSCSNAKQAVLRMVSNNGKITGTVYVAGLVGKNDCSKNSDLANRGNIIGTKYIAGLLGYVVNSSTEMAYNTGSIFGDIYIGGIIGYNQEGVTSSAYSTGKVDGDSLVGLMIGYNYNTTMADYYYLEQGEQEPFGLNNGGGVATPKTADEMKSDDFAELLGDDFVYDSGLNDGYPVLKWEKE